MQEVLVEVFEFGYSEARVSYGGESETSTGVFQDGFEPEHVKASVETEADVLFSEVQDFVFS